MQPADPQRYSEAPPAPDTASVLPREVQAYIDTLASTAEGAVASRRAAATAAVVAGLTDDEDIRKGAALLPLLEARLIDDAQVTAIFGETANRIATELVRVGSLGLSGPRLSDQARAPQWPAVVVHTLTYKSCDAHSSSASITSGTYTRRKGSRPL